MASLLAGADCVLHQWSLYRIFLERLPQRQSFAALRNDATTPRDVLIKSAGTEK
jgi:hypothetical protein